MSSDINVQTFSGKVNITSNLLVGSSHLFVDTINNRVGLVTTTPDAGIHVNSNAYVHTDFRVGSGIVMNDTSGRITAGSFVGDGSAMTGINSDSGSWVNGANSNVHLATSTDNVGIGTSSPSHGRMQIVCSSQNPDGGLTIRGGDFNAGLGAMWVQGSGSGQRFNIQAYKNESTNPPAGTNPSIADADAFELCLNPKGGNVGIGVTDPDSKLEVRGNIRASSSDTNHGIFIDAGGTILRDYGGNGAGLHFTANQIFPTNYLGAYSAGGIDLGSAAYRWNNVYTEALNASGTIDSTGIITCNANKMVITGSSPTLYLRDSDQRTGMIHQNADRMYFLTGPANSDSWVQTANSRWPLYLQMDTNEAVFGGNIDASVGTVTASTFTANSRINIGTSASIRQSSTSSWTGDPGSGVGKLEYHSNRWYIVAGSNSTELLQVRRNNTNKFTIDNNGSISLGTVPAARISGTVGTATNQSGGTVTCTSGTFSGTFAGSTASSRDKFRVYPTNQYCIGMQSGVTYGDLNDWSMTFQMNNDNDRGFWWGDDGHGVNQGAMALSTRGWLNVAERIKVGGGQTDTGAAGWNLQVQGNAYISSTLEADGRIYADNGCHVRGDWVRVNGQNGIYFESYGGGWNMTDSTWIRSYGTKKLHVNNEINTNNRVYASGYVYTTMLARYYSRVSGNAETTANRPISVYAEHHMRCSELQVTSDRRIKTDIVDVDDGSALELLRKIQPKTYGYVDTMEKGTKRVYGFIAQEIKELIPEAVDVSEGDLPNIYGHATVDHEQNTITFRDFDTSNLKQTDSIIYIDQDDKRQTLKIKSVLNSTQLEIEEDLEKIVEAFQTSELEEYKFTGEIFIWGQHVDDFHHLQKSAIYTVATAALQEVDRQLQSEKVKTHQMEEDLQAEKVKTRELEQKLEILEMSHASLIQRIEALEKL
jgi:hypothetical protein